MPCPPPKRETKAAALREEADFKAQQKDARADRAVKLHLAGEPHSVIMQRLGVSRPTLTKMLRDSGLAGNSVKPTAESDEALSGLRPLNLVFDGNGGTNGLRDFMQHQAEKWGA